MWVDKEVKQMMDEAQRKQLNRETRPIEIGILGIILSFGALWLLPEDEKAPPPKPPAAIETPSAAPAVQPVVPAVQPKPVQQYRT